MWYILVGVRSSTRQPFVILVLLLGDRYLYQAEVGLEQFRGCQTTPTLSAFSTRCRRMLHGGSGCIRMSGMSRTRELLLPAGAVAA